MPDASHILYIDASNDLRQLKWSGSKGARESTIHARGPFPLPYDGWTRAYSVAPDGRILLKRTLDASSREHSEIQVVVNWFEELKRLSPNPTLVS